MAEPGAGKPQTLQSGGYVIVERHLASRRAAAQNRRSRSMIHLSGMDASILHLETPEIPMHVGSLQIADLPPAARRGRQPAASAARVS